MPQTLIYLNGQMLPVEEARVSVFDYGLLYGQALYETVRSFQGKPFRLPDHLARLERGARKLGITLPMADQDLEQAVSQTLEANDLAEARIRITVTAGQGQSGPSGPPETGPTVIVTAAALPPESQEAYEEGHKAIISSIRRNSFSVVPGIKSTNMIENMLARQEATEKGAEQAIFLNEKRCFTECAFANIFFVAYGGLITPSADCGLLPGITRDAVVDLALDRGLTVDDRWINAEEIWDAEEIFVTSSIIGVYPVTSVNDRLVGGGSPGKITRTLTTAYQELVRSELGLTA